MSAIESTTAYSTKAALITDLVNLSHMASQATPEAVARKALEMAWGLSNTNTDTGWSDDTVSLSAGSDEPA